MFKLKLVMILSLILLVVSCFSLLVGSSIGITEFVATLLHGNEQDRHLYELILWEIRTPRTLLAVVVGVALGASGAALQGYLRNPLAEPSLIGVSSCASLAAVFLIYTGLGGLDTIVVPIAGISGALIGLILLFLLSGRTSSPLTLILAGIALSSFAAALTSLTLNFSPSPYAALEIIFWLLGSLANRGMQHVLFAIPFVCIGIILMYSARRSLDALTLGETTARSMGFNPHHTQYKIVAGSALAVGSVVAVSGNIGFIGLVVPHLLRPIVGHKPSQLLIPSALGGAILTLLADLLVRLIATQVELKLGVVTALIGVPLFIWLLLHHRRQLT